ncbi:hypothetical protein [Wenyingzhuangia sp. IMCC45574]
MKNKLLKFIFILLICTQIVSLIVLALDESHQLTENIAYRFQYLVIAYFLIPAFIVSGIIEFTIVYSLLKKAPTFLFLKIIIVVGLSILVSKDGTIDEQNLSIYIICFESFSIIILLYIFFRVLNPIKIKTFTFATSLVLMINSCGIPPSEGSIEYMNEPFLTIFEQSAYTPTNDIIYQFYHEYGFTDKVIHLNTIIQHDSIIKLKHSLPFQKTILRQFSKIDDEKYLNDTPINLEWIYTPFSDISICAKSYKKENSDFIVNHVKGSYEIEKKNNFTILKVFDNETKREFIEAIQTY